MIHRAAHLLIVILIGVTATLSSADDRAQVRKTSPREGIEAIDRKQIATVFGDPVTLDQVTPAEIALQQKKLPPGEFEHWLGQYRGRRIYEVLWHVVQRRYIEREKIGISDAELRALTEAVQRRMKSQSDESAGSTLTPAERQGVMVAWARASLMDWKVCKSLYEKYGGRVGIGSLGAWTAFDGQNALLREHIKNGDIQFEDATIEEAFWQHTRIDNFSDSYPKGDRLKELLATPPFARD